MFKPLTVEYFSGYHYKKYPTIENKSTGIFFRYSKIVEKSRTYNQAINNLIGKEGRYTISTIYDLDVEVGHYILLQEGELYTVSEIANGEDLNEQRSFFFKDNSHFIVLSLTQCANPLGLRV